MDSRINDADEKGWVTAEAPGKIHMNFQSLSGVI